VTPGLLAKLRRAGAIRPVWGLETASPRLQQLIHKGLDLKEVEQVLQWSHEAGIYNAVQIIAGLPTERDEDIEATVAALVGEPTRRDHEEDPPHREEDPPRDRGCRCAGQDHRLDRRAQRRRDDDQARCRHQHPQQGPHGAGC
jgi:radical SAM superfamily enzyme YgiQ (UPF0313 family)